MSNVRKQLPLPRTPFIPEEPRMQTDPDMDSVRPVGMNPDHVGKGLKPEFPPPQVSRKSGLIGSASSRWCLSDNHNWCGGSATRFSLDADRPVRARCECECHGKFV